MRLTIESLEPRRLCAAGDQDLSFGDNGFLSLRFGETPYQFLPGSDPAGTAFVVSMNANGRSFDVRKFNHGVADTLSSPAVVPIRSYAATCWSSPATTCCSAASRE